MLQFVPDELITEELCNIAIYGNKDNKNAIEYMPLSFRTKQM